MALTVLYITLALMAGVLFAYAFKAFGKQHFIGGLGRILMGSLLLSLSLLMLVISLSLRGYQALTQEQLAATVTIERTAHQAFQATIRFSNGHQQSFDLLGDDLLIEANILKWHPWANVLGLQTAYQLDRIAGRYSSIEDEQSQPRTVYSLAENRPINLLELSKRTWAKPFLDAQYGSATFYPLKDQGVYQLRVSTTGLLIRELE